MKAYKALEQLVLKNLVETMLPKDSGVLYGNGTAGDIWRSFLADQLATQVGKSIDLGVVPKSIPTSNSDSRQLFPRNSVQKLTAHRVPHSESM
ncbi:rod-binding protein [Methylocapsa sp. D3K7]|uniref:rod-binding protein n=1 Tax=Methylocapsa sp. D3K7 TaxID=3041435 RepID=UPI00244EA1DE|nr:rod-binding protein [Methylocapsa sp. D3K7]WGJ15683.1 rod-binding protein [Methylocapsa sp. D3K7]